jgi:hypothetical protein
MNSSESKTIVQTSLILVIKSTLLNWPGAILSMPELAHSEISFLVNTIQVSQQYSPDIFGLCDQFICTS